jgi:hypothetical protein
MKSAIENSTLTTKLKEIKDGDTGSFDSTKDSLYHKRLVIGEKADLPRSDMQGSLMSRLESMQLLLQNNPQLAHLFGVDRADKTLTLNTGENSIRTMWSDGTYLYVGLVTSPAKIVKIQLSDLTKVTTLTLDTGEDSCVALWSDGTYLYAGLYLSPSKIVKIDLATFTKDSTLTLGSGENNLFDLWSDGTYLYAGLHLSPSKIVKIDLATFTKDSTLTLGSGENDLRTLWADGTYLYAGCATTPSKIVKIKVYNFTKDSTLTLDTGENGLYDFCSDGVYLYAVLSISPGTIVKIDLVTFTKTDKLALNVATDDYRSIWSDGTYLYAASYITPTYISKVDLATFTEIIAFALATGENNGRDLFSDGTYLYIGLATSPAKIVRRYIYPTGASLIHRKLKKLEGHSTSQLIYTRPDRAVRIALTAGASWAYGSYVQVIAANNITTPFKVIGVEVSDMVADKEYQIGIGTGASASEVLKQETPVKSDVATDSRTIMFDMNTVPEIPANTRVAAKCACETDSQTCGVKLIIATKY